ncbi:putative adhesion G protein-coupled receptor E4P [Amia ocellicauda]|uniref:putative adhesion G protein-coupled receptor E4P n=1 Tax=Amia ocellicauda TaxID=2972642 RepID=UPI003464E3F4
MPASFSLPEGVEDDASQINECVEIPVLCGPNAKCINVPGSYNCSCAPGFSPPAGVTLTSNSTPCADIDDCQQVPPICGPNSICSNIVGSYNCTCETGYKTKSSINQCQVFLRSHLPTEVVCLCVVCVLVHYSCRRIIQSKADNGLMTCVYWKISDEEQFWSVEGCTATFSNTTYTVCSCTHLSTFALIMQTESHWFQNDDLLDQINKVLVIIGLFFFALAIITFVFCRWNPKINNTARLNLCICLFLAHLIFLVAVSHTENKVICSIIAGVLHYLFLSAFVWMFLESIQLFLLVRSLTKVRIIHREGLRPLYLLLIGYSIPVVVVGVSAGRFPEGYGGDKACWLKNEKGYKWMFLGPVCCILAVNFLLFGAIMWCIRSTLINMKSDVSQVKDTRIIIFKAVVQFVILGCGWILGFFPGTPLLSYLFIVLNSQQGTFIFIVHCLLNKEGVVDTLHS